MSKFIDKLNQISQTGSQPMGFRAARSASQKLKMLLVASLTPADVDNLADYVAGADAGLVHALQLGSRAGMLLKLSQAALAIPWGVWLKDVGQDDIKQIVETGCDFVIFSATDTPLALLQDDKVGKILEVATSLSDGLLRTVNELSLDAVLIAAEQEGEYLLTWHHLMLFQRFANLLTKPLLASVPPNVTADELQALWKAGVGGVVIEAEAGQPVDRLKKLRQVIDKLAFPSQRKRGEAEALLPHISRETRMVTTEEEEEE